MDDEVTIHVSRGTSTLCGVDHHLLGEARVAFANRHKATCGKCQDLIEAGKESVRQDRLYRQAKFYDDHNVQDR